MQLNYKTYGEGEPVIILHGLFGMLDNWQSFAKKLGAYYKVYSIDQRDHGRSPHTEAFNYKLLSEDLFQFIQQHDLKKVKLIGHSMGGRTIMQFALDHPELIDSMTVVDMGVKQYKGGHQYLIEALQALDLDLLKSRSEVDQELSKSINDLGVRMFLLKNLKRKPEGGYCWKMNLDLLEKEYENIMSWNSEGQQSEVQALFVRGIKSGYILDEDFDGITQVFPKASFADLDAGHWIHAERPIELLELVQDYFS